jgi:hypothetical protein
MFLPLVSGDTKELFEERHMSIQLLDDIERVINTQDRRSPSPHAERRGGDTPEPEKEPYNEYFWKHQVVPLPETDGTHLVNIMLVRLRDFIE